MALKSKDEPLQLAGRKLLSARFAGLECPGALEFPDLLLEIRLLVRQGTGPSGRGETDGAKQCYKRYSHNVFSLTCRGPRYCCRTSALRRVRPRASPAPGFGPQLIQCSSSRSTTQVPSLRTT